MHFLQANQQVATISVIQEISISTGKAGLWVRSIVSRTFHE